MKSLSNQVLTSLREALQVDAKWCAARPDGFTWLPHRVCQTITADPPFDDHGTVLVRVRASTRILRDVACDDRAFRALSDLNMQSTLSALVLDEESGTLRLECSAWFHQQNAPWLTNFFVHPVALQAAQAHRLLDSGLLSALGSGAIDDERPPGVPERAEPDEMLDVVDAMYRPVASEGNAFRGPEMAGAADLNPAPWVLANSDEDGLTAEFAFNGDIPAAAGALGTSLLTLATDEDHPDLGGGLLMRLTLPVSAPGDETHLVAARLNSLEARHRTHTHHLGAWCAGRLGLTHVTFFPAAVHRPRLLTNLLYGAAGRNAWARGVFAPRK